VNCAPIALFVYNRPEHARLTLEALARNSLADRSDLFIFSDGARTADQADMVAQVRQTVREVSGFKSVNLTCREGNLGLARSITSGVTQLCQTHGRVIVVEDDHVTSPHFLSYMNDALTLYMHEDRVASVHGYVFPLKQALPETFFLRGADCWGWGTWQRAWRTYNADGAHLLAELDRLGHTREFDYNGARSFTAMLRQQVEGKNDSWAIRWHASAFLANQLTLYPGRSLIRNIGFDAGTHYRNSHFPESVLSLGPIRVQPIECRENLECRNAIESFYRRERRLSLKKILVKTLSVFHRAKPPAPNPERVKET